MFREQSFVLPYFVISLYKHSYYTILSSLSNSKNTRAHARACVCACVCVYIYITVDKILSRMFENNLHNYLQSIKHPWCSIKEIQLRVKFDDSWSDIYYFIFSSLFRNTILICLNNSNIHWRRPQLYERNPLNSLQKSFKPLRPNDKFSQVDRELDTLVISQRHRHQEERLLFHHIL